MKILVGLADNAGQHSFDVEGTEEELLEQWKSARQNGGYIDIVDTKEERAVFAADKVAFILFRDKIDRPVGFGRI